MQIRTIAIPLLVAMTASCPSRDSESRVGAERRSGFQEEEYYVGSIPDSFYLSVTPGDGLTDVSGRWVEPATVTEMVRLKKCPMTITLCPSDGQLSKESIAIFKEKLNDAVALGASVVFYRELYWESRLKSTK